MTPRTAAFLFSVACTASILLPTCSAWRQYLRFLPNALLISCPEDIDCWGGPCGAPGHYDCRTGSANSFGKIFQSGGSSSGNGKARPGSTTTTTTTTTSTASVTVFGQPVSSASQLVWSTSTCVQDTDGDLKTNGDELGDPCCIWNYGDEPEYKTDITSPGHAASATNRPSCRFDDPTAPSAVNVQAGASRVTVQWVLAPTSCICTVKITYAVGTSPTALTQSSATSIEVPKYQKNFTFGGNFAPGTDLVIAVTALNFKTISSDVMNQATTIVTSKTAATNNDVDTVAVSAVMTMTLAGAVTTTPATAIAYYHVALAVIFAVLSIALPALLNKIKSPQHLVKHILYHVPVTTYQPDNYFARVLLLDLWAVSWGQFLLGLGFAGVMVSWFMYYYEYFKEIPYPFGGSVPGARALGFAAFLPLSIVLFPISKITVWRRMLGISYDRALFLHRCIGTFGFILSWLHGIILILAYATDSYPKMDVLLLSRALQLPSLVGFILFFITSIMCFGVLPVIRRKFYTFFYMSHLLFPVFYLLSLLHIQAVYPLIPMVVPGLLFYFYDAVRYIQMRNAGKGTRVDSVTVIDDSHIEIVYNFPEFLYQAGDYIFLVVPSLSYLAHPFSIASPPLTAGAKKGDAVAPAVTGAATGQNHPFGVGKFSIIVKKTEGSSRFTHRLYDLAVRQQLNGATQFISGPFGSPGLHLQGYTGVLLVGGGVGMTPLLSTLGTAWQPRQNVIFLWVAKSVQLIKHTLPQIETAVRMASASSSSGLGGSSASLLRQISVYIHYTGKEDSVFQSLAAPEGIHLVRGRPDLGGYIGELIKKSAPADSVPPVSVKKGQTIIGVEVCGPSTLVAETMKLGRRNRFGDVVVDVDQHVFEF